jgi:hypothetical protein
MDNKEKSADSRFRNLDGKIARGNLDMDQDSMVSPEEKESENKNV